MDAYRPDSMLAPVAWSLATLLTSPDRDRVKVCDGPDCGWMFVDASRNRSRRWCDMSDRGDRAKVRRYRRRGGAASR
jgi:predicted RNA-binding Zn ribbon-like protein